MKHEHTQGLWVIEDNTDHINIHNKQFDIATIYNGMDEYNCYALEAQANARLIAAAPELLEALEDIVWGLGKIKEVFGDDIAAKYPVYCDTITRSKRAILKARGE